ncbi:TetR/AcrR family transcriptional regulator [Lactobacillaceae bacterium Melli_B3]
MCRVQTKVINSFFKLTKQRNILSVSIDDIVRDAKIAKRSFYNYFANQEDIINYLSRMVTVNIIAPIDRLITNFPVDNISTIKQGASVVIEFIAPIIYENQSLINDLNQSGLNHLWTDPLYERCNQIMEQVGIKKRTNSMISNALTTFTVVELSTWITGPHKLSLNDFKNKVAKLITISIDELIK